MRITINNEYELDIHEKYLMDKDKKLYNTATKSFEGIEGDVITFLVGNKEISGTVEEYTRNKYIKLRGVEKPYENYSEIISIEHVSVITSSEDENTETVITTKTEILD